MSSLKINGEITKNERAALNTTIDRAVFDEFKMNCKKSGVAMNTLIEAFMRQYNDGGFYLKFGRTPVNVSESLEVV